MLGLTKGAGALLERMQSEQALPQAPRIQLTPRGRQFTVGFTKPAADDEVVCFGGTPVLYISAPAAEALGDCALTTQETPQGTTLTIEPRHKN